ncbi:MAG: hypothetical protein J6L69_07525 [Lachnospiraceae bacterium]|nr:hypothetical protein [Lachnospiraceae bacterium]
MKKKLLTVALAATMVISSALSAFAADTITGAWWTAWTPGYEVTDTVEFDIDVKGGSANYQNLSAVFVNVATDGATTPSADNFEGYKEYAVVRADSWGWGGGDNKSVDGNAITYTTTWDSEDVFSTENVNGDDKGAIDKWDDLVAVMKDAHIDAKISKTATGISLEYVVTGANGHGFTYTATTDVDTSAGLYVFFACDTSDVTVAKVEASADNNATDNNATDNNTTDTNTNAGSNAGATTPDTGDSTMVGILLAVAAVSVVVVLKRRTVAE